MMDRPEGMDLQEAVPRVPSALLPARSPAIFRFRVVIFTLLYFLGFYAPWSRYGAGAQLLSTTWIVLAGACARTGLLNLGNATVLVTVVAIAAGLLGGWLRLWATAYLGAGVMNDKSLRADRVMASGPYRYLRNPLYVGNLLTCVAVAILMPVSGAIVFLVGCTLLTLALVAAEGPHLVQQLGPAYEQYRALVPGYVPAIRSNVEASTAKPRWMQALAAEIFHVGYALCLLVFGWQYNVETLIRCLLICFGLSLVTNGIVSMRELKPAPLPRS